MPVVKVQTTNAMTNMIDKKVQKALQLAGFHAQGRNPAAVALGKLGGSIKSEKKLAAIRKNAEKGRLALKKKREEKINKTNA